MNNFLKKYGKDSVNHRIGKFHRPGVTDGDIIKVLDNPEENYEVKKAAISHPNATKEHISKVLNNLKEHRWVKKSSNKSPKCYQRAYQ